MQLHRLPGSMAPSVSWGAMVRRIAPFWATPFAAIALLAAPGVAQTWRSAYDGRSEPDGLLHGISGMAVVDDASDHDTDRFQLLAVQDNKDEASARFRLLNWEAGTISGQSVMWESDLPKPIDLEGLTAVPDDGGFLALESRGTLYHIDFDREAMAVTSIAMGQVPPLPAGSNLEAIELFELDGETFLAWSHRGQDDDPGILYWGAIDLDTLEVSTLGSQTVSVPAPVGNVRHISDLAITSSGQVFISSATDNGNDGPFESIVYEIGTLTLEDDLEEEGGTLTFVLRESFIPIGYGDGYKIEAIVRDPLRAHPAMLLGTDDENLGSAIGR